jgi:polyisoprenyl-phosphate glycosyltransferase
MVASEHERLRDRGETVELSIVVPVYGCRDCLRALHERIRKSVEPLTSSFELVLVDDRSPDGAWDTICALAHEDPAVRGVRLSRNFGQHAAITAGLAQSRGNWTVVMDCDLQEPPEAIPRLYATAREGYDIVYTARDRGRGLRALAARAYLALRNFFLETNVRSEHGMLSILSRKVVDAFLRLRDRDREYRIMLGWLGFRHATIAVERAPRQAGRSSYTLRRLIRVAFDGVFFQTTVLLRWIVFLGFLVAFGGVLLAIYDVIAYLRDQSPSGYTSLAVLILMLGGLIITSMGVIGLYVGRIFEQVKERPLYVIDDEVEGGGEVRTVGDPFESVPAQREP